MCVIVGYVGSKDATGVLLNGLSKLEYRGYDSAGFVVFTEDKLQVVKCKGRLSYLEDKVKPYQLGANIGIGHTRGATHGEPNDVNSQPHISSSGSIAVVHNGIIEKGTVNTE